MNKKIIKYYIVQISLLDKTFHYYLFVSFKVLIVYNFLAIFQNIMKITDGLFLRVGERVSKDYPDIQFNNMIIDNW